MCIFIPNMKFLCSNLWLARLFSDAYDDNYARRTNHDYGDLFGIIPNKPKIYPTNLCRHTIIAILKLYLMGTQP